MFRKKNNGFINEKLQKMYSIESRLCGTKEDSITVVDTNGKLQTRSKKNFSRQSLKV